MEIKRNEKGNIEFTSEEFATFLCEIGSEITTKLYDELNKRITLEEATKNIIIDMKLDEPQFYEEASERFNPFLCYKSVISRNGFVINAIIGG